MGTIWFDIFQSLKPRISFLAFDLKSFMAWFIQKNVMYVCQGWGINLFTIFVNLSHKFRNWYLGLGIFHLSECLYQPKEVMKFWCISVLLDWFSLFILATDPFASVFGNESFEDGFADFSTLSKVICSD